MISIRTKTWLTVISLGLAALISTSPARAQNTPEEVECHKLSIMTASKLYELSVTNNPFWKDTTTREAYLAALYNGESGVMSFEQGHVLSVPEKSSILLSFHCQA